LEELFLCEGKVFGKKSLKEEGARIEKISRENFLKH
jgi:hypothetical protein